MPDGGNRNMLWPNVVGQSGTARAAPVLVTSPPKTMSTPVAAAVSTARRCAGLIRGSPSVRPRPRRPGRGLVLREVVLGGFRIAVLVRAPVDGRQRGAPVEVRRRRGRRPLERGGVPGVQRRLAAGEQRPEEVDRKEELADPQADRTVRHEDVPVLLV